MALRIELRADGASVGGVEQWWDCVEAALENSAIDFPLLHSISPYGALILPHHRLLDLADECTRLAETANGRARIFLLKIADLCKQGAAVPTAELIFDGD